ncbi:MurR/RpiR family transcriptional regulator [Marinilactibacillus kalidii]|uniref:MurR/RpiR family transcriptional regulator n=1 Tax=Marinilactibacillus kalidii TaxID=2820274 RepID=UPI001ABE196E|nr:MurR/RpiR family transcriptional regulator [Marinilactibacillus kalidii]
MFIINLIKNKSPQFSETDKEISKYILEHSEEIVHLSITSLAEKTYTSKSSVLRFVQKLGFSGFTEFKFMIRKSNHEENPAKTTMDDMIVVQQNLLKKLSKKDFTPLYQLINHSHNIYLISTGVSQRLQCQTIQRDFLKIGIPMNMLPAGSNNDLTNAVVEKLRKDDLLIVLSSSGENKDIKEMLTIPLIKHVPIFSMTISDQNWLTEKSSYSISLGIEQGQGLVSEFTSTYMHMTIDFLRIGFEQYLRETILERNKQ